MLTPLRFFSNKGRGKTNKQKASQILKIKKTAMENAIQNFIT